MTKRLFILLLSFTGFNSFGQIQRDAPLPSSKNFPADSSSMNAATDKAGNKMDNKKIMQELDLSKEQKGKMKEIHQKNKAKKEAIINNDSLSEEIQAVKLKELRKETAKDINAILTPEQREKMKQLKKNGQKKAVDPAQKLQATETVMDPAN